MAYVPRLSIPAGLAALAAAAAFMAAALSINASTSVMRNAGIRADVARAYGKLPLSFEPNRGQAGRDVRYLARGGGYSVALTDTGALLSLTGGEGNRAASLRLTFDGASGDASFAAAGKLPGKANYLSGNDRSRWQTDIPTYAKIRRAAVYPGIDAVYYGRGGRLEYDFVVAPRADPGQIVLRFAGAKLRLAMNGDLVLRTGGETVRQLRPVAYQRIGGRRYAVRSRYELLGGERVGIALGPYDRTRALVIDPVLVYSTYLGGSGNERAEAIAVDAGGSAYVTGQTTSGNFPRQNPIDDTLSDNGDVFVTKFDPAGASLLYSTYIGGSGSDRGKGIAVDGSGNAYVAGSTSSPTFPTTPGAKQQTIGGMTDAFLTKLNPAGSGFVYSTFLGGGNTDQAYGVAIDGDRNAYVTGGTDSAGFPVAGGAYQNTIGGGEDAFVTKFNASGSDHVYSTFLGGSVHDIGVAIAVDSANQAHVVGETSSTNFPTAAALQNNNGGLSDAFVTKLDPAASALVYSTYLGGSADEYGVGAAVDNTGVYAVGYTESSNFPTDFPQQPMPGGSGDAFVTKFNPSGSAHDYSTYLGGSGIETAQAVAVDSGGDAYVTGGTRSTNFPTTSPFQPMSGGGVEDGFVTRFNAGGSAHVYSSYLGGGGTDRGYGIAVTGPGTAFVAGGTTSADFPTKGAFQANRVANEDAFVTKIGEPGATGPTGTGPGTGGTGSDKTAPVISRLGMSPTVFRAASRGASIAARRHRVRSRVSYTLSEAATVTFAIERAAAGRRVGGKCVRPTRVNRTRRRCTRYVLLKGSFRQAGRAGTNRFTFTGRLRNRKLRPGTYRLRVRAADAAKNKSRLARKRFRIVRR